MDQRGDSPPADAFIFFGATGDLAKRKVFPALAAMARKGTLKVPVILVARPTHDQKEVTALIRESLTKDGKFDQAGFDALSSLLQFVPGEYDDEALFPKLCKALGNAKRPVAYLAIPPSMFAQVATGLATTKCTAGMRIIVEKPFGRDRESAKQLSETLHRSFPETSIYRIDHYLGKEPVQNLIYFHLANKLIDASFHRSYVDHVQITMAETLGVEGRGKFYEEVGAIRDVAQNHMLQVIACLGMECPVGHQFEAMRDETTRVVNAMRALGPGDAVRGQYNGYRKEPGVAPDSKVETFAAFRLWIDNDRWDGVPFYVRVGKRLPVGATEIYVKYKRPLWSKMMQDPAAAGNYLRLRISPDMEIAEGTHVKKSGVKLQGQSLELLASYAPPDEMLPYERLFADALAGDPELFARGDMVDGQWRVVQGILNDTQAPRPYEPQTWGPAEAAGLLLNGATWHDPCVAGGKTNHEEAADAGASRARRAQPAAAPGTHPH